MYFTSPKESDFFDGYGFPPEMYGMEDYMVRDTYRCKDLLPMCAAIIVYFIYFTGHEA